MERAVCGQEDDLIFIITDDLKVAYGVHIDIAAVEREYDFYLAVFDVYAFDPAVIDDERTVILHVTDVRQIDIVKVGCIFIPKGYSTVLTVDLDPLICAAVICLELSYGMVLICHDRIIDIVCTDHGEDIRKFRKGDCTLAVIKTDNE